MKWHLNSVFLQLVVITMCAGCGDSGGGGTEDEPICEAQEKKCDGSDLVKCNSAGSDWDFFKECADGCEAGACKGTESCEPSCSGKTCGDDGCGGSCGDCGEGAYCALGGQCQEGTCTPQCDGKLCGNDGCGGSCGSCTEGLTCQDFQCVPGQCNPDCTGKVCGNDGCGGSCGSCAGGKACEAGQCVEPTCDPKTGIKSSASFPSVVAPYGSEVFAVYLAHLLGAPTFDDAGWSFADVTVKNTCPTTQAFKVTARLDGFSTPVEKYESLPAGAEITVSLVPTFDFPKLYGLPDVLPGTVKAQVVMDSGVVAGDFSQAVSILDVHKILLGAFFDPVLELASGLWFSAKELAATLATPKAGAVTNFVTQAIKQYPPPWGNSSGFGYSSVPYPGPISEAVWDIGVGGGWSWYFWLDAGETTEVELLSVSGGSGADIAVYFFSNDDYDANYDTLAYGQAPPAQGSYDAQAGDWFSFTASQAGWYYLVLFNTTDNWVSRDVELVRTLSAEETVRSVLKSLYDYLHAQGVNYTSLTSSVFPNTQYVRLPSETLSQKSGNCIDGTLVYASAIESLGLNPVMLFVPGHVFLAVPTSETTDSSFWVFLETTMTGSGDFDAAYMAGLDQYVTNCVESEQCEPVDIGLMRQYGVFPVNVN
jgi:hypothetical protein